MKQNKKINILHVVSTPWLGGVQTILRDITVSSKNQYIYCLRKDRVNMFKGLNNVFYYNSYKYYKFNPGILFDLYNMIKENDFKIVHLHLGKPLIYASILKVFNPKLKIIFHEHGDIFENKFLYNTVLRIFRSKVNLFIVGSKATKSKLIENAEIEEDKIKVLYNFVDFKRFNPKNTHFDIENERKKLGIRKEEFVIGFVGRLSKEKGCEYLIKSLPYLNFKYKVLIVGDGIEREILENLAYKLELRKKVIFLGYKTNMTCVYPLFDVIVMSSKTDSSPMVFYETQAMGIPLIGSNVSSLNELIVDMNNGLLFEIGNSKDLAKKIKLIYNDKDLRNKLIENGMSTVKKYSLYKYLKELEMIYDDIK